MYSILVKQVMRIKNLELSMTDYCLMLVPLWHLFLFRYLRLQNMAVYQR